MGTKKGQIEAYKKYRSTEKYRRTYLNSHLRRKYGISIDEYEALLTAQNNQCKICSSEVSQRIWKNGRIQRVSLFVDHCHTTGKVRGLLCNKCNVGLAMFNDSPELLTNAISYLKES